MDVTWERISRILELREILLSIQTGFSLVNAAVVCAILETCSIQEEECEVNEQCIPVCKLAADQCSCPLEIPSGLTVKFSNGWSMRSIQLQGIDFIS